MPEETTSADQEQQPADAPADAGEARRRGLRRAWPYIGLALVLALGLGLRIYELDRRSMWLDEFWALAVSAGHALESGQPVDVIIDPAPPPPTSLENAVPIRQVWFSTGETTHPPLYYVMLRLWREAFGERQVVARAMSVAFALGAIVLIWDIGRRLGGTAAGLWAALLMAVAVPSVFHSQEVRNYTPQVFFALAAVAAVVRMEHRGQRAEGRGQRAEGGGRSGEVASDRNAVPFASWYWLLVLTLALVAAMLTHYFTFGFALGLFVYAMIALRGRIRWQALGAFAAAGLLFVLIWGRQFWEQRIRFGVSITENNWLWDPEPGRFLRALPQALHVPAELVAPLDERTAVLAYLGAALFVLPLVLWKARPELRLPGLLLIFQVGMLLLLDATRSSLHLYHLRYSFVAAPAVYLLLAMLASPIRLVRHLLPAVAALSCLLPLWTHYIDAYVDWRWPARGMRDYVQPGDVLVFSSEGGPPYQAYQSFIVLSHYYGRFEGPIMLAPERPGPAALGELRRLGRTTWLVTGVGWIRPEEILPGATIHTRYQYRGTVDIWHATWPDEAGDQATTREDAS